MTNFLEETKIVLETNGKCLDDIIWVGCENFRIPTESFIKLADYRYDSGFGGQEVVKDLLLVGEDFWLERHEYDGSEWWEFKQLPKIPEREIEVNALIRGQNGSDFVGWVSLGELNSLEVG